VTIRLFGLGRLAPPARRPGLLKGACRRALRSERADGPGEISIVFLGRRGMRELNKRYLRHDYDTDVIAFRYPALSGAAGKDLPFGDIFVSAVQAGVQAKELGRPLLAEILTLILHGTLHLLGYEDSTPRKRARMFSRQEALLRAL